MKSNEDLKKQVDQLDKLNRNGTMTSASIYGRDPNRTGTALGNHEKSTNSGFLEELSFNHNQETVNLDWQSNSVRVVKSASTNMKETLFLTSKVTQ